MKTRRQFFKCLALLPLAAATRVSWAREKATTWFNDIHSKLNRTRVTEVLTPNNPAEALRIITRAIQQGQHVSLCGGRHAMGAQQFGTDTTLLDTKNLNRVLALDTEHGLIEVESGIQWPDLITDLLKRQPGVSQPWTITQKQTGADSLSVGGALAANIHSRGLTMRPIISDVESFEIITAGGEVKRCSRSENAELFHLAIGGYGLFGLITRVQLRLMRREKLQRKVELAGIADLMPRFDAAIAAGALYGDFQFSIDSKSDQFLQSGVFSTYHPVDPETPMRTTNRQLDPVAWDQLLLLAHTDKSKAFQLYADFYLETDGQLYWSDEQQMNYYSDDYHQRIDQQLGCTHGGSEMITEIYVPRDRLADFMAEAADKLRERGADVIYGTVRLIDRRKREQAHALRQTQVVSELAQALTSTPAHSIQKCQNHRRK